MSLAAIIKTKRKIKSLSQRDVADAMGMKLSTYSLKEREGGWTETELHVLSKKLKIPFQELVEVASEPVVVIDDTLEWLTKSALKQEAYQRVILNAIAEILSAQQKQSVTKILSDFSEQLKVELSTMQEGNSPV